jgi:scyllo-inositol 2-dehydrogenase (NADP+)
MAEEPIRAAVIGYGLAGSVFHAPLIASVEGMEVAAIVTGNPERREQATRDHPSATLYASTDDLWVDAEVYDLAVVATANRAHAPLSVQALERGFAVVVDKPMAATLADAEGMVGAAEASGRLLSVFHNRRWDADFLTVRKLVEAGALGELTRLESRFDRFREAPKEGAWREEADPSGAGGVLWDLGPHLIDQACLLFGEPTDVYAEVDVRRPGAAVDDDAFVALRFDGGRVAHLWMSQTAPIAGPRVRISGLGGAYQHDDVDPQEDQLKAGLRPGDADWGGEPPERYGRLVTGGDEPREERVPTERGAWEHYYEGVRDALLSGGPPPVAAADGVRGVRLVEAARRSAEQRQVVRLSA